MRNPAKYLGRQYIKNITQLQTSAFLANMLKIVSNICNQYFLYFPNLTFHSVVILRILILLLIENIYSNEKLVLFEECQDHSKLSPIIALYLRGN